MALKKIDVSGIDSAIAETRDDELRQKEIEAQSDLALQIRLFMKEAPYIIREIRESASPMDAQKVLIGSQWESPEDRNRNGGDIQRQSQAYGR